MSDYLIPGWFVWVIGIFMPLFLMWAIWATTQIFRNDKVIALNQQTLQTTADNVAKLEVTVGTRFDKLEGKLDELIIKENTFFKQLVMR